MHVLQINPEKIGALIGPGGKIIKGLCETHGVEIDIQDDGKVTIFATNGESMEDGVKGVEEIVSEVEVGAIYDGVVKSIKEFGAFVEVLPGPRRSAAHLRVGQPPASATLRTSSALAIRSRLKCLMLTSVGACA